MNKTYKIIILMLFLLIIFSSTIFAVEKLNLEIGVSKQEIKVGDKFTVTVDWHDRNASS